MTCCALGIAHQQPENEQAKLITTACEITRNETVKAQFFESVREQHGVTGNQYGKESLYLHCWGGLAGLGYTTDNLLSPLLSSFSHALEWNPYGVLYP